VGLRVLVIGPELVQQWTESVVRALVYLGCTVRAHFYNRSAFRTGVKRFRMAVLRNVGMRLFAIPQPLLQWYEARLAAQSVGTLLAEAEVFRPDLVLVLKGEALQASTLKRLKAVTGATLAVWWVDHPFMNAETRRPWPAVTACIPRFDSCFIFDRSYEGPLREAGARDVHFLPCAADPELFRPAALTHEDRAAYGTVVSLVGVHMESRARIVKALCGIPGLGIWGPGWDRCLADRPALIRQVVRGQSLSPEEACKVYNASLVNLNTHHGQSCDGGLNTRAFEILAAGGFELSDAVPGMETLLEPGRDLAVYRTPEEAADLARYYAKAEDERARLAEAGRRRVLAQHTYRHRMETLLNVVAR